MSLAQALGHTLDQMEENGAPTSSAGDVAARQSTTHGGHQNGGPLSLALRMSLNVASRMNRPVLYVTTRDPIITLTERLIGQQADLTPDQLHRGRLRRNEWTKVGQAVDRLSKLPLHFYDYPLPSLDQLLLVIARLQYRRELGMMVVDSISDMRGWSNEPGSSREIIDSLSQVATAGRTQVAVLATL